MKRKTKLGFEYELIETESYYKGTSKRYHCFENFQDYVVHHDDFSELEIDVEVALLQDLISNVTKKVYELQDIEYAYTFEVSFISGLVVTLYKSSLITAECLRAQYKGVQEIQEFIDLY